LTPDVQPLDNIREFLQFSNAEIEVLIVDDLSVYMPPANEFRDYPLFDSYLDILTDVLSGQYGLGPHNRYLYEVGRLVMDFHNLIRDEPTLLGEKILKMEEEDRNWWRKLGSDRPLYLSTVFLSTYMVTSALASSVYADHEKLMESNPYSKSFNENLQSIIQNSNDFDFSDDVFHTSTMLYNELPVFATAHERNTFHKEWGKAYVYALKERIAQTSGGNVLIITDNGEYLPDIVEVWDDASAEDYDKLHSRQCFVPPIISAIGILGTLHYCHRVATSRMIKPIPGALLAGIYATTFFSFRFLRNTDRQFLEQVERRKLVIPRHQR